MTTLNRRHFIYGSFTAASTALSSLRGADDKVNVAVIGLGGRGRDHIANYAKLPDACITAICDVNQAALERGQAQVEKLTGRKPKGYSDMRQVFDDKEIQAVPCLYPITGMLCRPSGLARQAKTSMSKSLHATTLLKAR